MSRIGRSPITIPAKVTIDVDNGNLVKVTGPKGTLSQQISPDIKIERKNNTLELSRPTDMRHHKEQHGLARTLIQNMVTGVTSCFTRKLEIVGVGYRVDKDGRNVTISGTDKCAIGELAAVIRRTRPPEPYQGKGIRYAGEVVKLKAGKTASKGGKK